MNELDWSLYPNFSRAEMACKCGCGAADMDPHFMGLLQAARTELGVPMPISSAYRCRAYNRAIGGAKDSAHPEGRAVDIPIAGAAAFRLQAIAFKLGFTGIGDRQHGEWPDRFIHLDTGADSPHRPRPRKWTYQAKEK